MRKDRACDNAIQLTYRLLRFIFDNEVVLKKDIKNMIKLLYSENKNTISTHIKIIEESGFIVKDKGYYTFYRKRGTMQ